MYFCDSQYPEYELEDQHELELEDDLELEEIDDSNSSNSSSSSFPCSQGHKPSLNLTTQQGGSICLLCFTNLLTTPHAPTVHVSYALSQLFIAISQPHFLRSLLTFHTHLLVAPLVRSLSSCDDEPIAVQIVEIIKKLCDCGGESVIGEFVARVSNVLASRTLAWSRRQVYMLHCFGILLDYQTNDLYSYIKDKEGLVSSLVTGLQLPSDDIQGEILFALYKLSAIHYVHMDRDRTDPFLPLFPKLVNLTLDVLLKTQKDDVRLNSIAFLTVLAQRGVFRRLCSTDTNTCNYFLPDNIMQDAEDLPVPLSCTLFAEAVKGALLSSDAQVQISSLDLIFYYLSNTVDPDKQIQVLLEENIAEYVFEILRLSDCKDQFVTSCLQVLDLLSTAVEAFKKRLPVGFATLIAVLHHVAEVPFHPCQGQLLKIIGVCITDCSGMVSTSQSEELLLTLRKMLRRHNDGDMGMLSETFISMCSILLSLIKSPIYHDVLNLTIHLKEALKDAVLGCLNGQDSSLLLQSLYLVKEACSYSHGRYSVDAAAEELQECIVGICKEHLLPWLVTAIIDVKEEEVILALIASFHSILIYACEIQAKGFAETLISYSWFSLSFQLLGLYPTEKMKMGVYMVISSFLNLLLGSGCGDLIRDSALYLPSDPIDLLFLLGQKNSHNLQLSSCQSAGLLILYCSSLFDERIGDDKLVLASLEQYILFNCCDSAANFAGSVTAIPLISLYGLYRGLAKMSYQIPYSLEAEKIFIRILRESEWDLSSARVHLISLKWLFQQEKICEQLSYQVLKLCRVHRSHERQDVGLWKFGEPLDAKTMAEIVAAEGNYAAKIFVCLFEELVKEGGRDHDICSAIYLMEQMMMIYSDVSNQLCLHSIGRVVWVLFHESTLVTSLQVYMCTLVFIFNLLSSVCPEALTDDDWYGVVFKLVDHLIGMGSKEKFTDESLLILGILCLVLHHSTNKALVETSKSILLNTSLASTSSSIICSACAKGPSLLDHDQTTSNGGILILAVFLYYFSIKSAVAILPEMVNWPSFFSPTNSMQLPSLLYIHCRDICRLLYFGFPALKLAASNVLLQLVTGFSDEVENKHEGLRFLTSYLSSVVAILEGLLFYSDSRVAVNCGLCLSIIHGWKQIETIEMEGWNIENNGWSRLIVEELAMSLAIPSLTSNSPVNHCEAALHVAVAMLNEQKIPIWMRSVFDESCITGILKNVAAGNVTAVVVGLFHKLRAAKFLNPDHVSSLNRVLQECRKSIYNDNQDLRKDEDRRNYAAIQDNVGAVVDFLMQLVTMHSNTGNGSERLLRETEQFSRNLAEEDGG